MGEGKVNLTIQNYEARFDEVSRGPQEQTQAAVREASFEMIIRAYIGVEKGANYK